MIHFLLEHSRSVAAIALLALLAVICLAFGLGWVLEDRSDDFEIYCDPHNYNQIRARVKGPRKERAPWPQPR